MNSVSRHDPCSDKAAPAVLEAFQTAVRKELAPAECYRAGIEAWLGVHPDHQRQYAARQAVVVMLSSRLNDWELGNLSTQQIAAEAVAS